MQIVFSTLMVLILTACATAPAKPAADKAANRALPDKSAALYAQHPLASSVRWSGNTPSTPSAAMSRDNQAAACC